MTVEKMEMLNMIGWMDAADSIIRAMVLSSSVHMVPAIMEIQRNNFSILEAQKNLQAVVDFSHIRQYSSKRNLSSLKEKLESLAEIFDIDLKVRRSHLSGDYDFTEEEQTIETHFERVKEINEQYKHLNEQLAALDELEKYMVLLDSIDINVQEMLDMEFIRVKFGQLTKYDMDKLKKNYENIPAIVLTLDRGPDFDTVLLFVPDIILNEVERTLKSLNFHEFVPAFRFEGTPRDWMSAIAERKREYTAQMEQLKKELSDEKRTFAGEIERVYSRLMLEMEVENVKSQMMCTDEFFYLTGWVSESRKKQLLKALKPFEDKIITVFKPPEELGEDSRPPTSLKNPRLLSPFESLLKMYGVPSYNEVDPTPFMGLSYLFLFGAMFGDLGQGFVLFLAGWILQKWKRRPNLGGVLSSLGASSMVFGILYGSVFGFENIIKGTFIRPIRPMENINFMLIAAIVLGVILLSVGYIYNMVNSLKRHDLESGLFSRNGLAGMLFYWLLLYYVLIKVTGGKLFMPDGAIIAILVLLILVTLFRGPLTRLIRGIRPLYPESVVDYYVDNGFEVIETLLSLFSNTLSFIRVGAFAINHVGLFMAFETLSEMMSSSVAGAFMIVLGNIVIIGLEGLIVFIQGLRLEYYELFSKYYNGSGYEYQPAHLRAY
jgi:V-type ATPase 116kDa subunit family.